MTLQLNHHIRALALPCLTFALTTLAQPVAAHVTFDAASVIPGKTAKAVLRVPHGCEGAATTELRVDIPEGVVGIKPMPKPGWTLAMETKAYAKPYPYFAREVSEGVKTIVWSGGTLPDAHFDEFVFQMHPARTLDATRPLAFPVTQVCGQAVHRWNEIATPGQDPDALKSPAPLLQLAQAPAGHGGHQGHGAAAPAGKLYTLKDLVIEAPWSRATPDGARVAGGFFKITNKGTSPDRLVGGTVPFANRFEVHEMAVVDGVMRMRELDKGLEIKPGETVELKPGSFHVMFMDLKEGLKAGQPVKGTLVFATAGTLELEYTVVPRTETPKGAPSGHGGQHKH